MVRKKKRYSKNSTTKQKKKQATTSQTTVNIEPPLKVDDNNKENATDIPFDTLMERYQALVTNVLMPGEKEHLQNNTFSIFQSRFYWRFNGRYTTRRLYWRFNDNSVGADHRSAPTELSLNPQYNLV
jgi:hypothetical protein